MNKFCAIALVAFAIFAGIGGTAADPHQQAPAQAKQNAGDTGQYDAGTPQYPLWHTGA